MGAMEKVLPFLFTLTVVFLTNFTLTMLSPDKKNHLALQNLCFHLSCFEVSFYMDTKSLPSAIKLFLRSNFLQTICGRKSSVKRKHHQKQQDLENCLTTRGQYLGHLISIDQSETSIQVT